MSVGSSMIEGQTPTAVASALEPSAGVAAGQLLRAAREEAGLHIAALAAALKVPVKKLEALEAGRYDQLPDTVFSRALACSVCRHLRIDSGPILAQLPQTARQLLADDEQHLNARFPSDSGVVGGVSMGLSPVAIGAVVAFLLLAAGIFYWPSIQSVLTALPTVSESRTLETTDRAGVSAGVGAAIAGASGSQAVAAQGPPPVVRADVTDSTVVAAAPMSMPLAMSMASASAASPAASRPVVPASPGVLSLSARGASWVDVTDARGTSVFRRTLQPGEVVEVTGVLPLAAVIGRADLTDVRLRGRSFDLTPFVRDNVARFEVK